MPPVAGASPKGLSITKDGAIQQQVVRRLDVSTLNDEQLKALECALLASMGAGNSRE
jgi:hypothetical protein